MGNVDKQQKYIDYDENDVMVEYVKVYSGEVSKENPDWLKEIEKMKEAEEDDKNEPMF